MIIRNYTQPVVSYAVSVRCTSKSREYHHFYKYIGAPVKSGCSSRTFYLLLQSSKIFVAKVHLCRH